MCCFAAGLSGLKYFRSSAKDIYHILYNWRRLSALTFMVCNATRGYVNFNTKCGNPPTPNKLPLHPWCLKNNHHFRFWTFLGIFSRGNILPFRGTVNWPSVMRLCCQFLGFFVQSGTVDLEQYENKSNKCLANPLYSVDAIPIGERYFSPC